MDCPAGYSATLENAMITGAETISTDIIGNRFTLKNFAASLSLFNPSQNFVGNTFILDGIASTRDVFNFQYNVGVFANNEISINNSSFRRVLYKAAQDVMIANNIINISSQDTGINAKIVDKASAAAWSIADVICNNIIRGYKAYTLPDGVTAQNNVVVTLTP